jgi:hypothetical protein
MVSKIYCKIKYIGKKNIIPKPNICDKSSWNIATGIMFKKNTENLSGHDVLNILASFPTAKTLTDNTRIPNSIEAISTVSNVITGIFSKTYEKTNARSSGKLLP